MTPFPGKKYTIWNTKRKNGWEQYRNKTNYNEELTRTVNIKENPDKIFALMEKELTSIKHICFGKIKVNSKDKHTRKLESLQEQKIKVSNSENESMTVKNAKLEKIETDMAEVLKGIRMKKHE